MSYQYGSSMSSRVDSSELGKVAIFTGFKNRGNAATIFDFENCLVVNLQETVLIQVCHPLETGDSSAWHPLDFA